MTEWHLPDDELRRYAGGGATPPALWSVEAHLAACAQCRQRLTAVTGPAVLDAGWYRLDTELDMPRPRPVERLIALLGVPGHTARLLAATPALRLSWLAAIASTLVLTAALAGVAEPWVFLAVAPLLPLLGVAASYGPGVDPTYEITVVAAVDTFRLLLLRTAAVLSATTAMSAVVGLFIPGHRLAALAWFLPALALTLLSLALTPRLGPVFAAGSVAAGWVVLVLSTLGPAGSVVFSPAGQVAVALVAAVAAAVLGWLRPAFDTPTFRRIT